MKSPIPDGHDTLVVRVLPNMKMTHDSFDERVEQFTIAEAHDLELQGRDVRINHRTEDADDHKAGRSYSVGTIVSSAVRGCDVFAVLAIDPKRSAQGAFASLASSNGVYADVSLTHRPEVVKRGPLGQKYVVKRPLEISLCRVGMRPGSTINHMFPHEQTLRLWKPHNVSDFVRQHGYEDEMKRRNVSPDDYNRYIDALVDAVHKRRDITLSTFPNMSSSATTAAATTEQEAARATDSSADSTADLATKPQKEIPTDTPPAAASAAATEKGGNGPSTLLTPESLTDSHRIALEMRNMTAEMTEMKRHNAEMQAQLAAAKQEKNQAAAREARTILDAFMQYTKDIDTPEEVEAKRAKWTSDIDKDPFSAKARLADMNELAIKMSRNAAAQNKATVEHVKSHVDHDDRTFLSNIAADINRMRETSAAYSYNVPRAPAVPNPPPQAPPSMPPAPPMATTKRPAGESDQPATKMQRLDDGGGGGGTAQRQLEGDWARREFENSARLLGRMPTYADVAYGTIRRPTGLMMASANGQVPEYGAPENARDVPADFGPREFAPDFWAKICERASSRGNMKMSLRPTMTGGREAKPTGYKAALV